MKKAKENKPVDAPPAMETAPVKPADLDAEFGGLVDKALLDLHIDRLRTVAAAFPQRSVVFMPVTEDEKDRAAMLARDVAMKERSACLDIMRKVLNNAELSQQISKAVCEARGQIVIPYTVKMTWDDAKGWGGEYKVAT